VLELVGLERQVVLLEGVVDRVLRALVAAACFFTRVRARDLLAGGAIALERLRERDLDLVELLDLDAERLRGDLVALVGGRRLVGLRLQLRAVGRLEVALLALERSEAAEQLLALGVRLVARVALLDPERGADTRKRGVVGAGVAREHRAVFGVERVARERGLLVGRVREHRLGAVGLDVLQVLCRLRLALAAQRLDLSDGVRVPVAEPVRVALVLRELLVDNLLLGAVALAGRRGDQRLQARLRAAGGRRARRGLDAGAGLLGAGAPPRRSGASSRRPAEASRRSPSAP
jgi:hypothetical protein